MNNKFKRALSSVLAFIMLLSCMTVMNVSSVWAETTTYKFNSGLSMPSGNGKTVEVANNISWQRGESSDKFAEVNVTDGEESYTTAIVAGGNKKGMLVIGNVTADSTISVLVGSPISSTNTFTISDNSNGNAPNTTSTLNNNVTSTTVSGDIMTVSHKALADGTYYAGFTVSRGTFYGVKITTEGGDTPVDPTTYTIQLGEYDTTTYPVVTLDKTSTTTKGDTVTASWEANTGYQAGSKSIELNDDMLSQTTYTITVDAAWFTAIGGSDIPTPSDSYVLTPADTSNNTIFNFTDIAKAGTMSANYTGTFVDSVLKDSDGNSTNAVASQDYIQLAGNSFKPTVAGTVKLYIARYGSTSASNFKITTSSDNKETTYSAAGRNTQDIDPISFDVVAGETYTFSNTNMGLFYAELTPEQSITTTDVTVTVNVKDAAGAAMDADSVSVALGTATATVASTTTGVYTATFADIDNTALAAGLTATATVTKSGYKTATGTATVTTAAGSIDVVLEAETPVNDDVTVTVYDSTTGNKVTGKIYYWVTLAAAGTTNELNISDGNGIIPVTEIAAGTYTPSGSIVANTSAATDMTDAITNGVLYVSAEGYAGAEVKLPASGNVNVQLVPLPTVNISEAGGFFVNAGKIFEDLLASGTADYAYQNPYIKSAEVNGFKMTAAGNNQVIKVMPKVNTRNETRDSLVQLSKGCTIEYTPSTSGQLTIKAASPNSSTTRGYAVDGTTTTQNSVTLTSTSSASSTFALTKDIPCTITITNTVDGDDGGINIYSIEFVPDEVQKYSVTLDVTDGTLGQTTVNVDDADLLSGTAYDEYSTVSITAVPSDDNKVAVTVNGVTVSLTDNAYTFTLTGETTIAVTYSKNEIEVTDKLSPLTVGETIDFTTASLTAKNESYVTVDGENKVKYFADAVSGGGKTSDIKLQANNATNYVEIIAGSGGNLAVTFNGNDIRVTGSDGSTQILSRSDVSANNDVMRTIEVTKGVTYTITALTDSDKTSGVGVNVGNAYISAVSLLAATVEAGKNITTIYATEEINDAEILAAYNASGADRYVRIIGQLNGITDSNATSVDEVGFVILNCSYADWENAGFADTNLQGEIKVSTVYPDVYSSTGFDSSKVADNGTYTGTTLNLSGLNTYFDTLVYGSDADFTGTYIYTFTEIDGTRYYYNSNAELTEKTF